MTGDGTVIKRSVVDKLRGLGGESLVGKMVALFLEHAPQRIAAAQAGIAGNDAGAVEFAVHALKSSAGNLGAIEVSRIAAAMERAAGAGAIDQPLRDLAKELDAAYAAAAAELERIVAGTATPN